MLYTIDIKNFHNYLKPNLSYPQNECFSSTDCTQKIRVSEDYVWAKIIENLFFNFKDNEYLFLLLENNIVMLYKVLGRNLIKIDLNNPVLSQ